MNLLKNETENFGAEKCKVLDFGQFGDFQDIDIKIHDGDVFKKTAYKIPNPNSQSEKDKEKDKKFFIFGKNSKSSNFNKITNNSRYNNNSKNNLEKTDKETKLSNFEMLDQNNLRITDNDVKPMVYDKQIKNFNYQSKNLEFGSDVIYYTNEKEINLKARKEIRPYSASNKFLRSHKSENSPKSKEKKLLDKNKNIKLKETVSQQVLCFLTEEDNMSSNKKPIKKINEILNLSLDDDIKDLTNNKNIFGRNKSKGKKLLNKSKIKVKDNGNGNKNTFNLQSSNNKIEKSVSNKNSFLKSSNRPNTSKPLKINSKIEKIEKNNLNLFKEENFEGDNLIVDASFENEGQQTEENNINNISQAKVNNNEVENEKTQNFAEMKNKTSNPSLLSSENLVNTIKLIAKNPDKFKHTNKIMKSIGQLAKNNMHIIYNSDQDKKNMEKVMKDFEEAERQRNRLMEYNKKVQDTVKQNQDELKENAIKGKNFIFLKIKNKFFKNFLKIFTNFTFSLL
jgi:hypothetical protein